MMPSGKKPTIIWGLVQIAARLGIDSRSLQRWLRRPSGERPPVRRCHRGFYAIECRLQDWVDAEDVDAGTFLELARARRAAEGPGLAKTSEAAQDPSVTQGTAA